MDTNSEECYNSALPHYITMSSQRGNYLRGVDNIVIQSLKGMRIENLLDIGAGDGRRSKHLADALEIGRVTAIESSSKMAEEARVYLGKNNVIVGHAEKREFPEEYFDAVICLWNVFGHIPNVNDRIEVLKKISKCLKPDGKCIIDVNNRYNLRYYGFWNVARNLFNDLIHKKDSGWFSFQVNDVEGKVYIHRPGEIERYVSGINLKVESVYYIDYESGIIREKQWEGQCVYVLSRIW